jgi:hypothetical protein
MTRVILALAVTAALSPAFGQTFVERPYDPPVGSRWQIISRIDSEQERGTQTREQHVRSTAELTIEQKLPDGFRLAYVWRSMTVTGSAPGSDAADKAFQVLKDVVIRARTDRAGKPVAIENLDEVRANMRNLVEKMAAEFEPKPEVGKFLRDLMQRMLTFDGEQAAQAYIEDIPVLASMQNIGLRPNDAVRRTEEFPNPLGGTMRSVTVTKLKEWDNAKGTAEYHQTREFDQDALRAFMGEFFRKLQPASNGKLTPEAVAEMMKKMKFDMSSDTVFTVENGMTRRVEEITTITIHLMGHAMIKTERKGIEVRPLAKAR